ncbi:DUF887-domain-containing protein [Hortaea werneckii]|nr:DUF887-domain-containing protein [Hortaea werneckii]KAI7319235.1 DUF887-domain-containing protein [Hortaea werneckii]
MKDPFPVAAPQPLVDFVRPYADALSLSTLPLHVHEVAYAFGLYTFIATVVSPTLSTALTGDRYKNLNQRTRINWDVHVVSFFQSIIICSISLYIMFNDDERRSWGGPDNWQERIWGYSGLSGMCQSFALGYFLWDFMMCAVYVRIFGWGMLAHAISATSVFMLGYRPFVYYYCPVFLLYELSSPFLNIHWFCDKLDLTGSIYQAVNGAFLTSTFFCCRIIWGLYNSYNVFFDMYTALQHGHGQRSSGILGEMQELESKVHVSLFERGGLWYGEQYLPLWLAAVYLASNLVLNLLNLYWFSKMIQTIRKRFDPPLGTKGVGSDAVHYEPPEKVDARKLGKDLPNKTPAEMATDDLHKAGRGSVKAAHEKVASEGKETSVDDVDGKIDIQRAVYADGHKGLEFSETTATPRRSARSRRKA